MYELYCLDKALDIDSFLTSVLSDYTFYSVVSAVFFQSYAVAD